MYKVVDHIHNDYRKRFATEYEAKIAAFKVARIQAIFNNVRIHLSVMAGRKQIAEIKVDQREEVR